MKAVHIAIALLGVTLVYGYDGQEAAERQQRILAAYSTRTILSMTTTTITSFYTCASKFVAAPDTCYKGRQMRRFSLPLLDGEETELASSLSEDNYQAAIEDSSVDEMREPRIALTVWSTTTTPYTWTATSIDTATTLSLSYWCSIRGANYPPACA